MTDELLRLAEDQLQIGRGTSEWQSTLSSTEGPLRSAEGYLRLTEGCFRQVEGLIRLKGGHFRSIENHHLGY